MGAGGDAGHADPTDRLAGGDALSLAREQGGHVHVEGRDAAAVVEDDRVAVLTKGSRQHDPAGIRRAHQPADRRGQVETAMVVDGPAVPDPLDAERGGEAAGGGQPEGALPEPVWRARADRAADERVFPLREGRVVEPLRRGLHGQTLDGERRHADRHRRRLLLRAALGVRVADTQRVRARTLGDPHADDADEGAVSFDQRNGVTVPGRGRPPRQPAFRLGGLPSEKECLALARRGRPVGQGADLGPRGAESPKSDDPEHESTRRHRNFLFCSDVKRKKDST